MDAAVGWPRYVYEAFQDFHDYCAPVFGRKQWRERSGQYLQALLVRPRSGAMRKTCQRRLQRRRVCCSVFLPSAGINAVIGRLQEPRSVGASAGGVGVGRQRLSQAGDEVGGSRSAVLWALGKIANCQAGVFLAHVGPRGRALVDKRLYLPQEWTGDGERCAMAGVPANRREYQSKTELAIYAGVCPGQRPPRTVGGWRFRGCRRRCGRAWRLRECTTFWTCVRI